MTEGNMDLRLELANLMAARNMTANEVLAEMRKVGSTDGVMGNMSIEQLEAMKQAMEGTAI